MQFMVIGHDGPEAQELRPKHRAAHLENIRREWAAGRILLAGPLTDKSGSLLVIEVEDEAAAKAMMDADPYTVNGIFERVEIRPFKTIYAKTLEQEYTG